MAETTSEPIKEIGGREGVLRVHGDGRELSGVIVNSLEGEKVNNGEATYAAWVYANEDAVNPQTFDYPNIFDNISNKLSLTQAVSFITDLVPMEREAQALRSQALSHWMNGSILSQPSHNHLRIPIHTILRYT